MARFFDASAFQYGFYPGAIITGPPCTISLWERPDPTGVPHCLAGVFNTGDDSNFMKLNAEVGGSVQAFYGDGSGSPAWSTTPIGPTAGAWNHIAAVFESTNSRSSFINGGDKNTDTSPRGTVSALNNTAVGRYNGATPGEYCNIDIAEVAMWNVALDDREIISLSKGYSPLMIRRGALRVYWRITGNASPELDSWKNRYDLTLVNGPLKSNVHPRVIRPG